METYHLTSYENGRIIKTIQAENIQVAKAILEQKGYDCQNDYFLESTKDADEWNKKNINNKTIYLDEIR